MARARVASHAVERDRPGGVPAKPRGRAGGNGPLRAVSRTPSCSARSAGSSLRSASTCSSTRSPTSHGVTAALRVCSSPATAAHAHALEGADRRTWTRRPMPARRAASRHRRLPPRARPVRAVVGVPRARRMSCSRRWRSRRRSSRPTSAAPRELCEDGVHGLIVPSRRHAALANAIEALIEDADRRGATCVCSPGRVERDLSFERRVKALDDIYQTLMEPQ